MQRLDSYYFRKFRIEIRAKGASSRDTERSGDLLSENFLPSQVVQGV